MFFINVQAININSQDNSSVLVNFGFNQSVGQLTSYKSNEGVGETSGDASPMTASTKTGVNTTTNNSAN